ncbi:unnamed protein product [Scytosiphon promiscuus]
MALQDSGIFIASSLIADTPEKDKENAEPTGDTPGGRSGRRSGEGGSRSARKSLLGRRRSSMGRRISGFGGGGFDVNANQASGELTNMYTSIIKLNSENKITRERCWGLKLIDFMDRVILDEGGQMAGSRVNFQKASCTLDASVKIYSHSRVDATHISSFSLLENLNRGNKSTAEDGRQGYPGAAVGSAERSTRLGVHETLKKADQLDQSETDRAFKMDPMFHKMSKIFDEAGSKGMLLNNLNVSDGCKVSFDSAPPETPVTRKVFARPGEGDGGEGGDEEKSPDDQEEEAGAVKAADKEAEAEAEAAAAEAARGMTDIRELRATLSSICGDLSSLALCPQLQEFREQIAEIEEGPQESSGGDRRVERDGAGGDESDSDGGGGGGFDDVPASDGASFDGGGMFGGGAGDDVPDLGGGGGSDDADPFHADNGEGFGGDGGGISFLGGADDDGDAGFMSTVGNVLVAAPGVRAADSSFRHHRNRPVSIVAKLVVHAPRRERSGVKQTPPFRVRETNNWAGASHWKFVGVKKKRPERKKSSAMVAEDDAVGGTAEEGGGRKVRGKRRPPAIDFDAPPVPENALAPPPKPKGRGRRGKDATLLSEEYVTRALKAAEDASSNYALPENAGFKTKDLAELFLRKGAFTKRWAAGETGETSGVGRADLQGFHDRGSMSLRGGRLLDHVFCPPDACSQPKLLPHNRRLFRADIGFDSGGGEEILFGDGFDLGGAEGSGGGPEVGADGVFVDNFEGHGLLSAERRVEKISVNYARKAKKVDVRRLKGDLWRKIDKEFQLEAAAAVADTLCAESGASLADNLAGRHADVDAVRHGSGTQSGDGESKEEEKPAAAPEVVDMTFSDIVLDVASREEQSGVTVPFYFICLLHLANEKGLKLEGREDLLDFSVESDPVKEGFH